MSFFSNLFRRKAQDELTPIKVRPLSQKFRMKRMLKTKKWYEAEVVIMFEDKPIGTVKTKLDGFSRDQVAKRIQDGLSLKVITAHETKK